MKLKVTKAKRYNLGEYYTNSYDIQNMLLGQVNFPYAYNKGDYMNSVYSDRLPYELYNNALKKAGCNQWMDNWATSASDEQLLTFVREVFEKPEITGCRILRFTNVSSGYPCYRFDVYIQTDNKIKTFSGQGGDNVEKPKMKVFDGIEYYEF